MPFIEYILIFVVLTYGTYHLFGAIRDTTRDSHSESIETEDPVITDTDRLLYAEDNEDALLAFDELLGETTEGFQSVHEAFDELLGDPAEEFQSVYETKKIFINRWGHSLARHTYEGDLEWSHGDAQTVKKISGQNLGNIVAVYKTQMTLGEETFDLLLSRVKPFKDTLTELIVIRKGPDHLQVWGYLDRESNVTQELWNLARENAKNGIVVQELLDVTARLEDPAS